jgi:hypothetical protein
MSRKGIVEIEGQLPSLMDSREDMINERRVNVHASVLEILNDRTYVRQLVVMIRDDEHSQRTEDVHVESAGAAACCPIVNQCNPSAVLRSE